MIEDIELSFCNVILYFDGSLLAHILQHTWDVNAIEVVLPVDALGIEIQQSSHNIVLHHGHP